MIFYDEEIAKRVKKNSLPKQVFLHLDNAFRALDATKDFNLFDIKKLKDSEEQGRVYYRLRKGKYRAIFFIKKDDMYVVALDKREEVYKKWR